MYRSNSPGAFSPLEADIKKLISSRASRGKIDMSMQFENSEEETYNFAINLPLAKELHKLLETLQQELNLSGEIISQLCCCSGHYCPGKRGFGHAQRLGFSQTIY